MSPLVYAGRSSAFEHDDEDDAVAYVMGERVLVFDVVEGEEPEEEE